MALSYIEYTGNGVQQQYTTPKHIDPAHIYVALGGVIITPSSYSIEGTTLTFNTAPLPSVLIRIGRKTSQETRLTDYQDASLLTADALDRDANQLFYMAQEAIDTASETNIASSTFYSATTTPPDTANLGDLWYDAVNKYLKIYNGQQWDLATPSNETLTFTNADFDSTTEPSYTCINVQNLNSDIFVFLNGVKLIKGDTKASVIAATDPRDFFADTVNNKIYFAPLASTDIVQVVIAAADISGRKTSEVQTFTAAAGDTLFTLTEGVEFIPNTHSISVYLNGVRQTAYTEIGLNAILFDNALSLGDEVVLIVNEYDIITGYTPANVVQFTDSNGSVVILQNELTSLNTEVNTLSSGNISHANSNNTGGSVTITNTAPTSTTGSNAGDIWLVY